MILLLILVEFVILCKLQTFDGGKMSRSVVPKGALRKNTILFNNVKNISFKTPSACLSLSSEHAQEQGVGVFNSTVTIPP